MTRGDYTGRSDELSWNRWRICDCNSRVNLHRAQSHKPPSVRIICRCSFSRCSTRIASSDCNGRRSYLGLVIFFPAFSAAPPSSPLPRCVAALHRERSSRDRIVPGARVRSRNEFTWTMSKAACGPADCDSRRCEMALPAERGGSGKRGATRSTASEIISAAISWEGQTPYSRHSACSPWSIRRLLATYS